MSTKILDHVIPVSVLHHRLQQSADLILHKLNNTSRWRPFRRAMLRGAHAAYEYEIKQLLEHSSRWQPFWTDLRNEK